MKFFSFAVLSLCSLLAAHALPARKGAKIEQDVEFVPLEAQYGRQPVVDTGVIDGSFGDSPFDGLFESFAGIMTEMRQQMDRFLKHLPSLGDSHFNVSSHGFPAFPSIDLGKGNTTSVTKVIDGHKVVINETEYKQEGDLGGSYFKVRVIDVVPDSSELATEKNAENVPSPQTESNVKTDVNRSKEPELVDDSIENEIRKNRDNEIYNNIETFDEIDGSSAHPQKVSSAMVEDRMLNPQLIQQASDLPLLSKNFYEMVNTINTVDDNILDSEEFSERITPNIDLSGDLLVNKLMADRGAPTNPDAEVFSNVELISTSNNSEEPLALSSTVEIL